REELRQFKKPRSTRAVERILTKQPGKIDALTIKNKGWAAIGPGVKRSYAAGRKARSLVKATPTPENLHEWRKRVKDLWYHTHLLRPIWPEQMCAVADELEALSEQLGDDHDLVMLKEIAG